MNDTPAAAHAVERDVEIVRVEASRRRTFAIISHPDAARAPPIGDALGAPFEGPAAGPPSQVRAIGDGVDVLRYTDDTHMSGEEHERAAALSMQVRRRVDRHRWAPPAAAVAAHVKLGQPGRHVPPAACSYAHGARIERLTGSRVARPDGGDPMSR